MTALSQARSIKEKLQESISALYISYCTFILSNLLFTHISKMEQRFNSPPNSINNLEEHSWMDYLCNSSTKSNISNHFSL